MRAQQLSALGYLSVLIPPALLALGALSDHPWLAFVVTMGVLPFARLLFGAAAADETVWSEPVAVALEGVPLLHGLVVLASIGAVWRVVREQDANLRVLDDWGLGFSLWITLMFATCSAHALGHAGPRWKRRLGDVIAGIAGYPILSLEHQVHHAKLGDTAYAEWPRRDEGVWAFAARRAPTALRNAIQRDAVLRERSSSPWWQGPLAVGVAAWLMVFAGSCWAGGERAAALYVAASAGVWFGMQLMAYIQHWGLGDDVITAKKGLGWEDDCQFQVWITLHIAYHQAHHTDSGRAYYRTALEPGSPRQPAGYVILMLACLVPALWRRLMDPVLDQWLRDPVSVHAPGRRLTCFSDYPRAG